MRSDKSAFGVSTLARLKGTIWMQMLGSSPTRSKCSNCARITWLVPTRWRIQLSSSSTT